MCCRSIINFEITPQPREKMNEIFRRNVLDRVTYPNINPTFSLYYLTQFIFSCLFLSSTNCEAVFGRWQDPRQNRTSLETCAESVQQNAAVLLPRFSLARRSVGGFHGDVHSNLSLRTPRDVMSRPAPEPSVASSVNNTPFTGNA